MDKPAQILETLNQGITMCNQYRAVDKEHDGSWANIIFVINHAIKLTESSQTKPSPDC